MKVKFHKMNKQLTGLIVGIFAGVIDIIPMIIQNLTWDANISAFSMWVISGFITSSIDLKVHHVFKGVIVSFMLLLPTAILIGWKEPFSLLPIIIMTVILGIFLGFFINLFSKKLSK